MAYIGLFLILFIILFIAFKIVYSIKIKKKKLENVSVISFFVKRYKLIRNKMNIKEFLNIIAIINSFIIAFIGTLVMYLDIVWKVNYFLELLIGFILMFLLIYSLYEIYGRYLVKKWGMKNGN